MNELGSRRLHFWRGKDRTADIAALADAVAATGELFDHGGAIVRLDDNGQLVNINRNDLHELITRHICGVRVVKNGSGWEREYYSYRFAQLPHPGPPRAEDHDKPEAVTHEPDSTVLDDIYRHELLERLPKVQPR
jgi:hypothetical protein